MQAIKENDADELKDSDSASSAPTLLSLPDDLLLKFFFSYLGRTLLKPSPPSPYPFFLACRRLYNLSRDSATRVEFLVGNYGTACVIEASGGWLKLLTADTLSMLLNHVAATLSPVPRYQMQRLYCRCSNMGRFDLLLPLLLFAKEAFPIPNSASYPNSTLSGRESMASAGMSFNPSLPDVDVFKKLVLSRGNNVPEELVYLVEDAKIGGWHIPQDDVMSALLSLKNRYGFDPNFYKASLAPSSSRMLKRDYFGQAHAHQHGHHNFGAARNPQQIERVGGFNTDSACEGTNGGYALLLQSIEEASEVAVRRLLRIGVAMDYRTTSRGDDSFFWQSMDEVTRYVGDWLSNDPEIYAGSRGTERSARRRVEWFFDRTPTLPFRPGDDWLAQDEDILDALEMRFPTGTYVSRGRAGRNALSFALSQEEGDRQENVLRLILEHAQETGWLADFRRSNILHYAIQSMMSADKIRFLKVLQSYSRTVSDEGRARTLADCLQVDDVDEAVKFIEKGQRLSPREMLQILKSNHLPRAHALIRDRYPFTTEGLTEVLDMFIDGGTNGLPSVQFAIDVLEARKHLFKEGAARALVCKWFNRRDKDWMRPTLRDFIGPLTLETHNSQTLLLYDLGNACRNADMPEIHRLSKLGAKLSPSSLAGFYPSKYMYQSSLVQAQQQQLWDSGLGTLVEAQRYTSEDLGEIVLQLIGRSRDMLKWLLDKTRKVKPVIGSDALKATMKMASGSSGAQTFKELLECATWQPRMVDKSGVIRNMAIKRGGEWQAAWTAYEEAYKTGSRSGQKSGS